MKTRQELEVRLAKLKQNPTTNDKLIKKTLRLLRNLKDKTT